MLGVKEKMEERVVAVDLIALCVKTTMMAVASYCSLSFVLVEDYFPVILRYWVMSSLVDITYSRVE